MENEILIEASCSSYIGEGRAYNEDNFYFNKKRLIKDNKGMESVVSQSAETDAPLGFAVFDGIGGASYGEEASYTAAGVFAENIKKLSGLVVSEREFLLDLCKQANDEINLLAQKKQASQIGTTMVSLLFSNGEVYICNVGDSKAFLVRNNKIIQISKDHTDEKFLTSIGINKKPSLLQYLGLSSEEGDLDPFISKGKIKRDDIYVLCTDGVTDAVSATEIYKTVKSGSTQDAVKNVISLIKQRNGQDNATVIVIKAI